MVRTPACRILPREPCFPLLTWDRHLHQKRYANGRLSFHLPSITSSIAALTTAKLLSSISIT